VLPLLPDLTAQFASHPQARLASLHCLPWQVGAAVLLGELLVILIMVIVPRGTEYQLTVVWIGVFVLILVRGGGRISIDRMIGREF